MKNYITPLIPFGCPFCGDIIPRTTGGRQRTHNCGKPDCARDYERARKQFQRRKIRAKAERCESLCCRCGTRRRQPKPKNRGLYKWCRWCRMGQFVDHENYAKRRAAQLEAERAAAWEADLRMQERAAKVLESPAPAEPTRRPPIAPLDAMEF